MNTVPFLGMPKSPYAFGGFGLTLHVQSPPVSTLHAILSMLLGGDLRAPLPDRDGGGAESLAACRRVFIPRIAPSARVWPPRGARRPQHHHRKLRPEDRTGPCISCRRPGRSYRAGALARPPAGCRSLAAREGRVTAGCARGLRIVAMENEEAMQIPERQARERLCGKMWD